MERATNPGKASSHRERLVCSIQSFPTLVSRTWVQLVAALFPDRCVACRQRLEVPADFPPAEPYGWCSSCVTRVVAMEKEFCLDCGDSDQGRPCLNPGHTRLRAALQYGDVVASLIRRTKYDRQPALFNVWLRAWIAARGSQLSATAPEELDLPELLVPIPLHPTRIRERGFDPVGLWVQRLSQLYGIPIVPALRRTRATPSQTGLNRGQRRMNVAGAFATGQGAAAIRGRRVALVDDVATTGSTLRAAAKVLGSLDPQGIEFWAFAYEP